MRYKLGINDYSHEELVRWAHEWLTKRHGKAESYREPCYPVFTEKNTWSVSESPDVIGWDTFGSFLIECKVSQSDFYSDRKKWFRKAPAEGMGKRRYYLVPIELAEWAKSKLPENWGLLGVTPKTVRVIVQAKPTEYSQEREIKFLRSAYYGLKVPGPPTPDIKATRKDLQAELFAREVV